MVAIALALAGGRLAAGAGAVADTATLSILAEEAAVEAQARAALSVLRSTEGIQAVRVIEAEEQRALLAPWLGTEVPVEGLTLPLMIEVTADRALLDAEALRTRLAADAPAAVYDDHSAWRGPLVAWAEGLRRAALAGLGLAAATLAVVAGLAAAAGHAAGRDAAAVLALAGAGDGLLAGIRARRAARAALVGTAAGCGLGLALLAGDGAAPGAPLEVGLAGLELLLALPVVAVAGAVAAAAAALTVRRLLRREG
jgi:cell division transport system permease protein